MRLIGRRAQSASEYAVVLLTLALAFSTMSIYVRRSLQAGIKTGADSFSLVDGAIVDSDTTQRQGIIQETHEDRTSGQLVHRRVRTDAETGKSLHEMTLPTGEHMSLVEDHTTTRGTLLADGLATIERTTVEKRRQ